MDSFVSNSNQEKIFNLIYSNSLPNDKIAFEIIKNLDSDDVFFPSLVAIALTSDDKFFANDILLFIESKLSLDQKALILRNINGYTNYDNLYFYSLKNNFPHQFCANILYTYFKRTGKALRDFLCADDGSHSERRNMFKLFLEESKFNSSRIRIPGLLPHEIEIYVQHFFTKNNSPIYQSLHLEYLKSDKLPTIIFTKKYKEVLIDGNYNPTIFPSYIFKLSILKNLNFKLSKEMEFPEDWSSLSELVEINFRGHDYIFKDFNFIDTLPKLKNISLGSHYLSNPKIFLRKKTVPISGTIQFISREGYTEGTGYQKAFLLDQNKALGLAGALGKSILSIEEQEYYFKKLTGVRQFKKLEELPFHELITLMNVNFAALRNAIQTQLDDHCEKENGISTLNVKSLLHIAGNPSRSKTEIKKKLKELNIPFTDKPDDDITHLIICKNPKLYKKLVNRNLQLVSEQALYQIFKADAPGFIEAAVSKGDDSISNNILQFINSDDIPNVLVGLEMLKNGGVPKDLIEPLLVVFKTCPDSKARGLAKKILLQHAPAELLPLINDTQRFTGINANSKAQDINKKLEKIAKNSSRNLAAKMSLLFHKRYKKGLRYILYHFHKPCQERTDALLAMMEGTHFNFAPGLGFTNWKERGQEAIQLWSIKAIAKFPIDIVDHVPLIESANFHNCKFNSLPAKIGEMKDLKRLDLSFNFIKKFPKSFIKLTQLEHLDLQMNNFEEFPKELFNFPNLKLVDFRKNQINGTIHPIIIDAEIRNAMKDCEILV